MFKYNTLIFVMKLPESGNYELSCNLALIYLA